MFATKEELDAHLLMLVEAEKRDHRKLGKELELFTIINEVGPGLPLFYPKGAILRRLVENYVIEEQEKRGYVPIWIPHITKGELYEISGHLDKYDAMYSPMVIDDEDYYLKPMNCPHFMMLYKSLPHSYKELPLRYTCTTTCYRYEKSGELSGLTRVRSLTQDDCHVFCTAEQIENEIEVMLGMIGEAYKVFGLNDFEVKISLRDPKDKEKYLGSDEVWQMAEDALRKVVAKTGWKSAEEEGEAAFYGPKLDFKVKDAIGREWQLSTIQLDFNMPEKFELEYTANDSSKQRPVVIHRAILGSTERFLGILIEHMAGNFPTWLAPVQVKILTISDKFIDYANDVASQLRFAGIRVEVDHRAESIGKKIRETEKEKVPYSLIIGEKEMNEGKVAVRVRHDGDKGAVTIQEFKDMILEEIKNKK
jgi:threonyl-tRNA synthetase